MGKYTVRVLVVFLVFLFGRSSIAQTSITGKVSDKDTGEEMIAANIVVTKNGIFVSGETTDIDGNYRIQVDSGEYDLEVSYTGYPTQKITGIPVDEGQATKVDVQLKVGNGVIMDFPIFGCCLCIPLIQQDKTTTGKVMRDDFFKRQPTREINEMILMTPGVTFGQ